RLITSGPSEPRKYADSDLGPTWFGAKPEPTAGTEAPQTTEAAGTGTTGTEAAAEDRPAPRNGAGPHPVPAERHNAATPNGAGPGHTTRVAGPGADGAVLNLDITG